MASPDPAQLADASRKWRVRSAFAALLLTAILIGGSGRPDWLAAWLYVLLVAASQAATFHALSRTSPDLVVERARMQPGSKPWDKIIAPLVAIVLPVAVWLTAALDKRYEWSRFDPALHFAGFTLALLGILLMLRSMMENRFFAATVRIQSERGHAVVSTGPYSFIRHPGYVGLSAYVLGTPFALDSAWAVIPALLCVALVVLRTALEDRTLRAELPGYGAYALRVRYRLLPFLW